MQVWELTVTLLFVCNIGKCEEDIVIEDSQYDTEKMQKDQAIMDKKRSPLTTGYDVVSSKSLEEHLEGIPGIDEERGPRFYNYDSSSVSTDTDINDFTSSLSEKDTESVEKSVSDEASSAKTREATIMRRAWRDCTPCTLDMVRKHTNIGIKWICGAYQRARRTFKSECLMRFRNCQDGTMFVKVADTRCSNDSYHGKHWFYVYRV